MKTPMPALILLSALSFFATACGDGTGSLCRRAADCDVIDKDSVGDCQDDLKDALDDDLIDQKDVDDCNMCLNDIKHCEEASDAAECATECREVLTVVTIGSIF